MWQFSGAYAEGNTAEKYNCNTLSLGIFYVGKEKGENGRKKSAVVYRVKGFVSEKEKAIKKAQYLVDRANSTEGEVTKEMFIKWAKEYKEE